MAIEEILVKFYEYVKESHGAIYNPELIGYKSGFNDELRCIGQFLCGENWMLAYEFMNGSVTKSKSFFDNVKHNGQRSNPLIRRAIEIHIMNRN